MSISHKKWANVPIRVYKNFKLDAFEDKFGVSNGGLAARKM